MKNCRLTRSQRSPRWLQSQEEPIISEAEEKALLARLDKAAAELDAGKGVPLARVREKIRCVLVSASRVHGIE